MSRILRREWRLAHLYRFKPKGGGLKTFRPNKFQSERFAPLYAKIDSGEGHKEIVLKSRKFGTTTGCCFFCLDIVAYRKYIEEVTRPVNRGKGRVDWGVSAVRHGNRLSGTKAD